MKIYFHELCSPMRPIGSGEPYITAAKSMKEVVKKFYSDMAADYDGDYCVKFVEGTLAEHNSADLRTFVHNLSQTQTITFKNGRSRTTTCLHEEDIMEQCDITEYSAVQSEIDETDADFIKLVPRMPFPADYITGMFRSS